MAGSKNTERQNPLLAVGLQPKAPAKREREEEVAPPTSQEPQASLATPPVPPVERKPKEEQATEKVTAYFTPGQYDRIEELRRQYRKRTGKRISVNALLRQLVERSTVEDILGQ